MSTADTGQDLRFSLYEGGESGYVLTDNSSSGFMFFNQLEDKVDDVGVDWTTFFSGAKAFGSVKVGLATTASDREFLLRYVFSLRGRNLEQVLYVRRRSNESLTRSPDSAMGSSARAACASFQIAGILTLSSRY